MAKDALVFRVTILCALGVATLGAQGTQMWIGVRARTTEEQQIQLQDARINALEERIKATNLQVQILKAARKDQQIRNQATDVFMQTVLKQLRARFP